MFNTTNKSCVKKDHYKINSYDAELSVDAEFMWIPIYGHKTITQTKA